MKNLNGKVAVVTGAASGVGRALAVQLSQEGMKIVLADIEPGPLDVVKSELMRTNQDVVVRQVDVSSFAAVEDLAKFTFDTFGGAHLVCNNAGVGGGGSSSIWDAGLTDWQWVLSVNLWGVIHGIKAFVPRMLAAGEEGHILNTGSINGIIVGGGIYGASKHAVLSLSETLYLQLGQMRSRIGVTVLCPGPIRTRLGSSQRNRPLDLYDPGSSRPTPAELSMREQRFHQAYSTFLEPSEIAHQALKAIRENQFYVVTHNDNTDIKARFEAILGHTPPLPHTQR